MDSRYMETFTGMQWFRYIICNDSITGMIFIQERMKYGHKLAKRGILTRGQSMSNTTKNSQGLICTDKKRQPCWEKANGQISPQASERRWGSVIDCQKCIWEQVHVGVCASYSLSNIVGHQIFSIMDYKYKVSVCCCQVLTKKTTLLNDSFPGPYFRLEVNSSPTQSCK